MLIACNNKGCMQHSNAMLNVDTKEVICAACNAPISNISDAMKRALKSTGQILRLDIKKAFVMACRSCNANREVVLNDKDQTVCKICTGPIQVHAAMKQAIKEFGEKLTTVVEPKEVVAETDAEQTQPRKRKAKKSDNE